MPVLEEPMISNIPYSTKRSWQELSRLHGKLLFCHKTFTVACDEPKDSACDRDYYAYKTFAVVGKQRNPRKFPATKVSWYMVQYNLLSIMVTFDSGLDLSP